MMIVDIDNIKHIKSQLSIVNSVKLDEIEFYEYGKKVEIDKIFIDNWKFTGLNNIDFITSGAYKNDFKSSTKTKS